MAFSLAFAFTCDAKLSSYKFEFAIGTTPFAFTAFLGQTAAHELSEMILNRSLGEVELYGQIGGSFDRRGQTRSEKSVCPGQSNAICCCCLYSASDGIF